MYVRIFFADIVLMLIVNKKNESFISLIPFMEQRGGPERNQTQKLKLLKPLMQSLLDKSQAFVHVHANRLPNRSLSPYLLVV